MPAAGQAGLSGLAVATAAAGGVMLYSGLRGVSVVDALRQLTAGQPITAGGPVEKSLQGASQGIGVAPPTQGIGLADARAQVAGELAQATARSGPVPTAVFTAAGGGTSMGARAADDARRYLGRPYAWGAAGPDTFDCSGLVTWVLGHDLGIQLPSARHTITTQFFVWSGAQTVPRAACAAGD